MSDSCCEAMAQVMAEYEMPFSYPIQYNPESGELSVNTLCVKLLKMTPGGNFSRRGHAWMVVNFCPACGKQLQEMERKTYHFKADVGDDQ